MGHAAKATFFYAMKFGDQQQSEDSEESNQEMVLLSLIAEATDPNQEFDTEQIAAIAVPEPS